MIKSIITKMVTKKKLEDNFGPSSGRDVPEASMEIDELAEDIKLEISGVLAGHLDHGGFTKFSFESLEAELNDIADEIVFGNIIEDAEFTLMDREQFLETYAIGGYTEEQREVFDNVYYYMNDDMQGQWLFSKYIQHDNDMYTNNSVDFVIIVNEQ